MAFPEMHSSLLWSCISGTHSPCYPSPIACAAPWSTHSLVKLSARGNSMWSTTYEHLSSISNPCIGMLVISNCTWLKSHSLRIVKPRLHRWSRSRPQCSSSCSSVVRRHPGECPGKTGSGTCRTPPGLRPLSAQLLFHPPRTCSVWVNKFVSPTWMNTLLITGNGQTHFLLRVWNSQTTLNGGNNLHHSLNYEIM